MAIKYSKIWLKLCHSHIQRKSAESPHGTVTAAVYGHNKTINTVDGGEPYTNDNQ